MQVVFTLKELKCKNSVALTLLDSTGIGLVQRTVFNKFEAIASYVPTKEGARVLTKHICQHEDNLDAYMKTPMENQIIVPFHGSGWRFGGWVV